MKLKGWGIGDPIEITVRENNEGDIVFEDGDTEICLDQDDIPKLIKWLQKASASMTESKHPLIATRKDGWPHMPIMIMCPMCGNNRCPKAEHEKYKCTGCNEPGQICELEASDEATETRMQALQDLADQAQELKMGYETADDEAETPEVTPEATPEA
jgi:hypothetical protein